MKERSSRNSGAGEGGRQIQTLDRDRPSQISEAIWAIGNETDEWPLRDHNR